MKKIFLILMIGYVFNIQAQYYNFSKSTGTYSNLTGSTIIDNSAWTVIEKSVKIPFAFKYWNVPVTDSIYLDNYAASLNDFYDGEISFLGDEMQSKGAGLSPVSYLLQGSAPNRIFKIEYRNARMAADLKDSLNLQLWLYETSNIIEFRYGPNRVKSTSWADNGAFVGMANTTLTKFISLEKDPANPKVNTGSIPSSLMGMPANGTVYKFTPSATNGIDKVVVKVNILQNKISIPSSEEVKSIKIYNVNGQIVQSVASANETNLSDLGHGLFVVVVETAEGLLTQKLVL